MLPPPRQPNGRPPAASAPGKKGGRGRHLWAIGVPVFLVLLVSLVFGVHLWLDAFLRSADFRHFLERKTSALLRTDSRLEPLHWEGSDVYSDALAGTGYPNGPWTRLSAEQIRAELNLGALWHRVWRIETIELAKVTADLGTQAGRPEELSPEAAAAEPGASSPDIPFAGLLPSRVEVGRIHVADLALSWGGQQPGSSGRLQGAELTARPREDEHSWTIDGRHGRLTQASLPALSLEQFTLQTNNRELTISQSSAQVEGGGEVTFSGNQQLAGDKDLDLNIDFDGLPSETFLPPDWRARLHGLATGTVRITGSPSLPDAWQAHGHIDLHAGHLEALPVLDELAVFTATARFRQAALQKSSADFAWQPGRLTITHLLVESEGLIRLEGGFTVQNQQIDGLLRVGVARSAGRLLAGIGARVFNLPEQDGYLWTTVRLSGPARSPQEDLTGRLVQATQDEVIEKAQQGASTVLDTASGLLNLLKPPP